MYSDYTRSHSSNHNLHSQHETEEPLANFGNNYSDHYLRTGVFPQAHIQNAANPLVGYPKLQRLHDLKEIHTRKHACRSYSAATAIPDISPRLQQWVQSGVMFDVILVGGCFADTPPLDTLISLPIAQLTPRPSIALIWVPSHGLETARHALSSWGFRRSEDIVYMSMSKDSIFYPPQHPDDFIEKSTWHCLMGLKGTLRRSEDADLINCNIDTDTVLESPSDRPNVIPENIYRVIENFALMSRRLHILPGTAAHKNLPVRPRPGWVIVGPDCLVDDFASDEYLEEISRIGTRVPVNQEIEILRPRTPPRAKRNDK